MNLGRLTEAELERQIADGSLKARLKAEVAAEGKPWNEADLRPLHGCDIETDPYPGLATDLQPPTCVLLSQTEGISHVHETVFEDRLEWLGELRRMGARVDIRDSHHATIEGPSPLHGAEVEIGDLRAGASLILAALAANGTTTIRGAHHVHRGYEKIDRKFLELGARIERLAEGT
jgi:UDP-N-acetylglucosamine 1-carboxyvinyltransferase